MESQFIFQNQDQAEEVFHQKDLIQLFPYGISIGTDPQRPFLIFKDDHHEHTLPVAINPLEAGISISQSNPMIPPTSPHRFAHTLLQGLGIQIQQCVFVEIKGSQQYVRLYFTGSSQLSSLKVRADEAMSLCLFMNVPIFSTKTFIGKSRQLSVQKELTTQSMEILPQIFEKGVMH